MHLAPRPISAPIDSKFFVFVARHLDTVSFFEGALHAQVPSDKSADGVIVGDLSGNATQKLACRFSRSSAVGCCPVAPRIIHLDSDHKGIIHMGFTMNDTGTRVEIATD
jgi:hypothetical protein